MPDPFDPNDPDAPPVLGALNVQDNVQGANPFAPSDPYGGMGMFSPASLFDNKDFRRHAGYEALTNAGLALIAASAPSSTPQTAASAFGALAGGAAQGVQGSADKYMKQLQLGAQMQNMRMRQQMMQGVLNSPDPTAAPQAAPQDAGAPAPAPAAAGAPNSLGITDNNIGNVEAPKGSPTRFQQYPDFNSGVAATIKNAQAYPAAFNGGKPMDLTQIADHWTEDNKKAWAVNVSAHSGLPLNQPLDLSNPDTAAAFARGVHGAEKGAKAVQPPDAYRPGVQLAQAGGPQPMPQGGDQPPAGNQPGVMPAPQQGGIQLPPPPTAMPIPKQLNAMLLSGDPGMKAMAQSRIAQINTLNSNAMERWKANVALLQHNQTTALAQQKEARESAQAAVDPVSGQPQQGPITAAAQKAAAVKGAQIDAEQKGFYPESFKGKTGAPLLEEIQKQRPGWASIVDDLHSGKMAISDISQRMQAQGIDPSRTDFVALTRQAYPNWNMRLGEQRKIYEGDIYDQNKFLGRQRAAIDLAYKHIDQYGDLMRTVTKDGWDSPAVNNIVNAYKTQTGNPAVTNAQALQHILSSEIATAVRGGQLAEADIQAQLGTLDTAHNWEQSKGTLGTVFNAIKAREGTMMDTAKTLGIGKETRDSYIGEESRKAQEHFGQTLSEKEAGATPAPAPAPVPKAAISALQEGHNTTFKNGQVWTLKNGQPVQVK